LGKFSNSYELILVPRNRNAQFYKINKVCIVQGKLNAVAKSIQLCTWSFTLSLAVQAD